MSRSYPIGPFVYNESQSQEQIDENIETISTTPDVVKALYEKAETSEAFSNRYRKGGWTFAQVVHHMSDSHINAFCRFKLALTESHPQIKPYEEAKWAEMSDYEISLLPSSIEILRGIHGRWSNLLGGLTNKDFDRKVYHPDSNIDMSVSYLLQLYAWHSKHHIAHLKLAIEDPEQ